MRLLLILCLWIFTSTALAQAPQSAPSCPVQVIDISAAQANADGSKPAADQSDLWQTVTLPDNWNARHAGTADTVWYRIHWQQTCAEPQKASIALLIPSITLAGEVYINDHLLWRDAQLTEPLSRSWNMPRYWLLQDAWLHEGVNTLWVRATGLKEQSLGIGSVSLGEFTQIQNQYDNLWWHHRTLYVINIIVSGVIGILFFAIWIIRRDQTADGWYALSSLFWVMFASSILVTSPWPFQDSLTFARVNAIALMLCVACFCMFTLRFGALILKLYVRILWVTTSLFIVALIVTPQPYLPYVQVSSLLVTSGFFLFNCVQFPCLTLRKRKLEYLLLTGCLLVLFVTGLLDGMLLFNLFPGQFPVLPYANIVITLCLSGILGLRQAHNVRRIEQFNVDLAQSVAEARSELAATLEREYDLALNNTRLKDRLDIAHDLHDGLGGSLVHMMASVELGKGPVHRPQVISMLKLIRDDLRQTIDSNSSPSIKVPDTPREWVAPLRHRFSILFDELGIQSDWQFPDQWLSPPNTLQCLALTRIVEEALTNIIKHSRARQMHFKLYQQHPVELVLEVTDNGIGFDVFSVQQANISIGMRSMAARISKVGGMLEITSQPGHTLIKVTVTTHTAPLKANNSSQIIEAV